MNELKSQNYVKCLVLDITKENTYEEKTKLLKQKSLKTKLKTIMLGLDKNFVF